MTIRYPTALISGLLMTLLSACVTSEAQPEAESSRTTVVIVRDAQHALPPSGTFRWAPSLAAAEADPRFANVDWGRVIRRALTSEFQAKGYREAAAGEQADLTVSFVLALESQLTDEDIQQLFGMSAGFVDAPTPGDGYEKGTFVLDMMDSQQRSLWRGVMQGKVFFDIPEAERASRAEKAAARLFQSFP